MQIDPDTLPAKNTKSAKKDGKRQRTAKAMFGYDATLAIARNPRHDGTLARTAPPTPASRPPWSPASPWTNPATPPAPTPSESWPTSAAAGTPPVSSPVTAPTTTPPPTTSSSPRALGYRLVFDYRQDQLGIQAGTAGAQLIEGTWY